MYLGEVMKDIAKKSNTQYLLEKYQLKASKKYGQNFLIDLNTIKRIVETTHIDSHTCVIEIGPGIGALSEQLAYQAGQVISYDIDERLKDVLKESFGEFKNVEVIFQDFLTVDLKSVVDKLKEKYEKVCIVANLPYYITTPIIMGLFEGGVPIESITVMVQKEVAMRMQAGPGTKDYGALSLAVQYYAEPYLAANVPPNCFMPRPNVGSAVIRLTRYAEPAVKAKDEKLMFALIRASFNQRRKTLQNGLNNSQELSFTKEQIAEAIEKMGLSPSVRGEALTLEQFAKLSDLLTEVKNS